MTTLELGAPLVALDFDGCIRPLREARPDDIRVDCLYRADEYPDMFHRKPEWSRKGQAKATVYLSRVAVEWARSLVDRGIDTGWATTWQRWANMYFGEALGFTLPVLVDTERTTIASRSAEWKAAQLTTVGSGRPVLWIDDNPPWTDRTGLFNAPGFRFLMPDYGRSIDEEIITLAEEWLAEHGAPPRQPTMMTS